MEHFLLISKEDGNAIYYGGKVIWQKSIYIKSKASNSIIMK